MRLHDMKARTTRTKLDETRDDPGSECSQAARTGAKACSTAPRNPTLSRTQRAQGDPFGVGVVRRVGKKLIRPLLAGADDAVAPRTSREVRHRTVASGVECGHGSAFRPLFGKR